MGPLDERYFAWLYGQVADPQTNDPSLSYWRLFKLLYKTKVVWFVFKDDNRLEDGKNLRVNFLRSEGLRREDVDPRWMEMTCSFLELTIALSDRLRFEVDPDTTLAYWFWVLMENIGLNHHADSAYYEPCDVEEILNRVIFRLYEPDGRGGFFPLKHPQEDQRDVELWYQLGSYVVEMME